MDAWYGGIAISAGVDEKQLPTRVMKGNGDPLVNDEALVQCVNPNLEALFGKSKVIASFPAVTGSEDFQEVFKEQGTPYVFLLIGVAPVELFAKAQASGRSFPYSNHNPDFFVDLAAIPIGAKANTMAVLSLLLR